MFYTTCVTAAATGRSRARPREGPRLPNSFLEVLRGIVEHLPAVGKLLLRDPFRLLLVREALQQMVLFLLQMLLLLKQLKDPLIYLLLLQPILVLLPSAPSTLARLREEADLTTELLLVEQALVFLQYSIKLVMDLLLRLFGFLFFHQTPVAVIQYGKLLLLFRRVGQNRGTIHQR